MTELISGLDLLKKWHDDPQTIPSYAKMLDIELDQFDHKFARMRCHLSQKHTNILGIVHGGLTATLIDEATGCASISLLQPGEKCSTIDLHVKYLKGIPLDLGIIYADAKIVHQSRRFFTVDCLVTDADGTLYAHGVGSFYVMVPKS